MSLATERTSDLHIDWDVPLPMRDGTSLRADVFRPLEAGRYPVLLSYGPYGKWLSFQDGYPTAWDIMVSQKPEVAEGSSGKYQNWEVADPERWVPYGYVCVRVDSRGAGRSPGVMDCHSPQEIEDLYECIEWAGVQPWSSGKVGLSGISYYAINQWRVAALNPPHLAAIMVWEGYQDRYRDGARHGGILCSFAKNWLEMQVKPVQHGMGTRGKRSSINGDWVSGPETLDDETLSRNRVDAWPELSTRHTDDAYYAARRGDLSRITVPLLSAGNWGGHGLHLRGNVEGFLGAGSQQKWLELHGGAHWVEYYTDYGVALHKRFFDHFLKGEDNGWNHQPRVQLQVRHVDHFVPRSEHEWPLARTQWTRYYLDPNGMRLTTQPPEATSSPITYDALGPGLTFRSEPLESELELTGPSALKIRLSSVTMDADVFAVLRVFEPGGDEVLFYGALDPKAPVAQGWLRASHRKLDPQRSLPYRPYHTHDELMPLEPGRAVDLDVEIWPTSIVIPKDYRLALTLLGRDYEHEGDAARLSNMKNAMRGCGPFIHDAPDDRPAAVFGQSYSLHFDAAEPPHVLVPVIPG